MMMKKKMKLPDMWLIKRASAALAALRYYSKKKKKKKKKNFFFFFFFQVQPYNRKYRCIGHRVWSMSLNFLTEL